MSRTRIGGIWLGMVLAVPILVIADESLSVATSAFQSVYEIGEIADITVPAVVEMSLSAAVEIAPQFLLVEESDGTERAVSHYYQKTFATAPVVVRAISGSGAPLPALNDERYDTTVDFPLTADEQTSTVIELTSDAPVTSSQIRLHLAPNVALPNEVKLEAETEVGRTIVVATKRLNSTLISFPETTSDRWFITLTHGQPLRLSEVALRQNQLESTAERSIRWLAQPEASYTLYTYPDRSVSVTRAESGNLRDDRDVLEITAVSSQPNAAYVAADIDEDGIADQLDNCVSVANADQTDVNENGRGDACDDFDRDGVLNHVDNCRDEPNRAQRDEDGDGIGDSCDQEESRVTEKHAWIPWVGMGLVGLVILGLFGFMLRQSRQENLVAETEESETMTSDMPTTDDIETKEERASEKLNQ